MGTGQDCSYEAHDRLPVRLPAVPLRLLEASEAHFDDLFRELQMVSLAAGQVWGRPVLPPASGVAATEWAGGWGSPVAGSPSAWAPSTLAGLAGLAEQVRSYLALMREPVRHAVREASHSRDGVVDIVLAVGPGAADLLGHCERFLARAAEAARAGELLTEPPCREVQAWRRWLARELLRQVEGKEPRPCPFPAARGPAPAVAQGAAWRGQGH